MTSKVGETVDVAFLGSGSRNISNATFAVALSFSRAVVSNVDDVGMVEGPMCQSTCATRDVRFERCTGDCWMLFRRRLGKAWTESALLVLVHVHVAAMVVALLVTLVWCEIMGCDVMMGGDERLDRILRMRLCPRHCY